MTLSLSLEDLSHRYPQKILMRGLDLYQRDRVGDIYHEDNRIEVVVEGEQDEYMVRISLNKRGQPVDTDCTCPFCFKAGYCKHIVAVLVKLITEKITLAALSEPASVESGKKEEKFGFPLSPLEMGRESARFFELPRVEETDTARWAKEGMIGPPLSDNGGGEKKQRWTARIEIYYRSWGGWLVHPVLVYIKKDGTPGRRDTSFDRKRITEPLPDETLRLIQLISSGSYGHEMPLIPLLDFLIHTGTAETPRSLPFFTEGGEPFTYSPLDVLTLQFDPAAINRDSRDRPVFKFRPELAFDGRTCDPDALEPAGESGCYLISGREIRFYPYPPEQAGSFGRFFNDLRKNRNFWDKKEMALFYGQYETLFSDRLIWGYRQKGIKEISAVPRPILTGRDLPEGGALFILSFDYGSRGHYQYGDERTPYEKRRNYSLLRLREEETPEDLAVFSRNFKQEEEIHSWLKTFLNRRYTRRDFSSRLAPYQYQGSLLAPVPLWTFLESHGEALLKLGLELRLEKTKGKVRRTGKGSWNIIGLGFEEWLKFSFAYETDGQSLTVNLEDFLEKDLLRAGSELLIINAKDREKLKSILKRADVEGEMVRLSPLDHEALTELAQEFNLKPEGEMESLMARAKRLEDFKKILPRPVPKGFEGTLRPYQMGGVDWLHFLHDYDFHGCLADDMGLGKTVQALCFLESLRERNLWEKPGVLILAPVTTLGNWKREAEKFTPRLEAVIHAGQGRAGSLEELAGADLVLASYQTFLRDRKWMAGREWHYLILDEAQAIKNWQSKTRRAVKSIPSRHRLALTGTPVENGLEELWSLFDVLDPGLLGPRNLFRRRYLMPIERDGDLTRTGELKKRLAPFLMRRRKEDVLDDLPDKEENLIWLDMGEEQRALYEEVREGYLTLIRNTLMSKKPWEASMEILSALLRLRQIALIPAMVKEEFQGVPSVKMDYLLPFLDDIIAENHRVLIFSQFTKALGIVAARLDRDGRAYAYLDGQTKRREQVIDSFQSEGGPPVFLISLKAGGVGINLTSADYVVLLDPWWNPAAESQAVDRAHRIGQKRSVIVYRPVVRGTVEEKVLTLQDKKKRLVDQLITEEKGFLKNLSKEDVLALFG